MAVVDISPDTLKRGPRYHIKRLSRTVVGCCRFILIRRGPATIYVSAEANFGLLYTMLAIVCARLRRVRIFIHHHSFSYITSQFRLMSLLTFFAGKDAHHIFLCETMQSKFISQYGVIQSSVVSNLATLSEPIGRPVRRPTDVPITVGILSNLTLDKGVREFLEVVDVCISHGINVAAVLAGPADGDVQRLLESRISRSSAPVRWIGPVYDEEKSAFFDSLDVFLFPTTYAVEAQPTVLLEAAAHGLLIIATDLGCISEDIARVGGYSVPHGKYVARAVEIIASVGEDRDGAWKEGAKRMEAVRELRETSLGECAKLIASVAK